MIGKLLCRLGWHDDTLRWFVPSINAVRVKCGRCHRVVVR